jgi:hypothetical protein
VVNGILNNKPATMDTIKKARKGLTFAHVIKRTSDAIHTTSMRKVIGKQLLYLYKNCPIGATPQSFCSFKQ